MTFILYVIFCKQMTAYEVRISDWSSDVCSSDRPALPGLDPSERQARERLGHADQLFSARIRIGTVTNAPFDPLENRRETEEDIDAVERPVAPDATPRRRLVERELLALRGKPERVLDTANSIQKLGRQPIGEETSEERRVGKEGVSTC